VFVHCGASEQALGRYHDTVPIGIEVVPGRKGDAGEGHRDVAVASSLLDALAGMGAQGLESDGDTSDRPESRDTAIHEEPGPAIPVCQAGKDIPYQRTAERSTAIDDQDPPLAGRLESRPHLAVVLVYLDGGDRSRKAWEPAIIAKPGGNDADPGLVAVAEIGRGEAHRPPFGDTSMDLDVIRPNVTM